MDAEPGDQLMGRHPSIGLVGKPLFDIILINDNSCVSPKFKCRVSAKLKCRVCGFRLAASIA